MRFFRIYQYVVPLILFPTSYYLWLRRFDDRHDFVLLALSMPVVFAYVIPGLGTNWLKLWEFNTRWRLGKFRPHHGFVFGSATAMIAWLCHGTFAQDPLDVLRTSFVCASVLGFWNLLYDVNAIQSGILRVYNQPWAEGKEPAAVAMDYAPWFFAGFGAVYGAGVGIAELLASRENLTGTTFTGLFPLVLAGAIAFPVLGYRRRSFTLHGHSGCRPVERKIS